MTVRVIIGPPCSGKSTRARHCSEGRAVIVDYDALAGAIGSDRSHESSGDIRDFTFIARAALIDEIIKREEIDAFIIHSSPTKEQIEIYRSADFDFEFVDTDQDECMKRCEKDGRPEGTKEIITNWFNNRAALESLINGDDEREALKMSKEFRAGSPVEIREDEAGTIKVSVYAAVFDSETDIGGMFREKIERGAFTDAVGRDDVVFLVNHDGLPLARTRSGTLTLKEDKRGLFMESELDANDPDVRAIVPKMKRGDLDKMSFAFMPEVEEWDDSGDIPVRTIRQASLHDVSIVTHPAYNDTDIGLRSYQPTVKPANEAIKARLRMKLALSRG